MRGSWARMAFAALIAATLAVGCADPAPTPTPPPPVATPAPTLAPTVTATPSPAPRDVATATPAPLPAPAATATSAPTVAPTPTATSAAGGGVVRNAYLVAADPGYADGLQGARISTRVWKTDFRFHTVPYDEIFSGGVPRDGIPPIYEPLAVSIEEADAWVEDVEPVIVLEVNGEARAYPLQVLTWHEIANDELGGVPVAVTFCPLCNSAVVFDRRLDGAVYEFGVSGNLRNSDLIMWDRQTESWWQQLTGNAIAGELAGARLDLIAAQLVSWAAFKEAHPNGDVLSRETGHVRDYGSNPYVGYDRADNPPFLFLDTETQRIAETDPRLLPKERVVALDLDGDGVAIPYAALREERVVALDVGGEPVVVFFAPGTASALGASRIAEAEDVGATGAFRPSADGQALTFRSQEEGAEGVAVDAETGSAWSITGAAVSGPLAGARLERVNAQDHFWFAWAAFKPRTRLWGAG